MAKCPKCECEKFKLEKITSPTKAALLICSECNIVISSLEDLDFNKWYDRTFKNHGFFESQINILKSDISSLTKKVKEQNDYIIDLLEILNKKLR